VRYPFELYFGELLDHFGVLVSDIPSAIAITYGIAILVLLLEKINYNGSD
jgi:hypothetical protein